MEVIKIEGIKKIYTLGTQKVNALDGVDISINRNEYVAITEGSYFLNGTDVSNMDDNMLSDIRNREIGFIFQSFNLLPRYNAMENVALPLIYSGIPRQERERRAIEALNNVGLGERMEHKPSELSGGQRQRVAIARALINRPSIILADEPTGNLDTKTSIDIMMLFEQIYKEGNTVIIVTHEEDIAKYARRIIRLRDGKIESDSTNNDRTVFN